VNETTLTIKPYKGLMPYREEDAEFFFGREREREIITANLISSRFTLLYGASGVGKTSVLCAGVTNHLRQLARQNLEKRDTPEFAVAVFHSWRDDPLVGLTTCIQDSINQLFQGQALEQISSARFFTENLKTWTEHIRSDLFIILDQFEDYFLYHAHEDGQGTFAVEFPRAVNCSGLRVNFLISIREEALAKLDRFEGRIYNLFGNYLRIEHLDREAAHAAIEKPIEKYNCGSEGEEQQVRIEPALVEEVLNQLEQLGGQIVQGETRPEVQDGKANSNLLPARIETPYLQLVMTRLWDEEIKNKSRDLRLETLKRVGEVEHDEVRHIVDTQLDTTMRELTPSEQGIAACVFNYLVTPDRTKIAYTVPALADRTKLSQTQITPVLHKLSGENIRILHRVASLPGQPDVPRYEISHDVLAQPILDWQARYIVAKARVRRWRLGIVFSFLLLVLFGSIAYFAFEQKMKADSEEPIKSILENIQKNVDVDLPTAWAVLGNIADFSAGIQAELTYFASSDDSLSVKQRRIKYAIERYFESEKSLVQVSHVNRKPIDDYEVKVYLDRLAILNKQQYTKVELLFDPDYLGVGPFTRTGENSYELGVSMWQTFRAWRGDELIDSSATRRRFSLSFALSYKGTTHMRIRQIFDIETIPLDAYRRRFKSGLQ